MVQLLHRRHHHDGETSGTSRTDEAIPSAEATAAAEPGVGTAEPHQPSLVAPAGERSSILRVPTFSPLAPIFGWLLAWGAITVAASILEQAGVDIGFNLGIAEGGPGSDGFLPGLALLLVSFGAFLAGGYAVARMARANGMTHAALLWVIAMIATGADAIVEAVTDGTDGVIQLIGGIPFWAETGLTDGYERVVVFVVFAAAQLAGSLIGGGLGQTRNRVERSDDVVVVHPGAGETPARHERADEAATQQQSSGDAARREPSGETRLTQEPSRGQERQ